MEKLDRRFFREQYSSQRLLASVLEEIREARSFERVAPRVVSLIEAALHPEFVSVMVRKPSEAQFRLLSSSPSGQTTPPLAAVIAEGPASATVTIDAGTPGEPISSYVYGQFIEHLGRCIYGGLWAEMLEDRKFYYPVTGDAPAWEMFTPGNTSWEGAGRPYELLVRSPWLVLGDKRAVTMSRDHAWTGAHSPRLDLPGKAGVGLAQERLALVGGREYVGRVVLAGDASAGPVEVSLVWGGGASDRETVTIGAGAGDYATHPLHFQARGTTDNGRLEIVGRGTGTLLVGAESVSVTLSTLPSPSKSAANRSGMIWGSIPCLMTSTLNIPAVDPAGRCAPAETPRADARRPPALPTVRRRRARARAARPRRAFAAKSWHSSR
jgi:hypothetical protein